jgi:putative transposase
MDKDELIIERKHRLDLDKYKGFVRISFTVCVLDRKILFVEEHEDIINEFISILKDECVKQNVNNWAYVFMPDHLHIILEGTKERSDLWKMMCMFKQRTGYVLKTKTKEEFKWQKDFWDHIHRDEDYLPEQILYIAENPVRKKLCKEWKDYKYAGSLHFNLSEIINNM